MTVGTLIGRRAWTPLALGLARVTPAPVQAHCDGLEFIHFVERLYEASTTSPHGHFVEPELSAPHR